MKLNRMKKRIFGFSSVFLFLITTNLIGVSQVDDQVLDWEPLQKQFVPKKITREELNLKSTSHYVLENFSIHSQFEKDPILLEQVYGNQKLLTLGYQLQKIESRFNQIYKQAGFKNVTTTPKQKIIIRVDAPYVYSPLLYYDPKVKLKNTALTIPPSEIQGKWNNEMWFAPKWDFPIVDRFVFDRIIDTAACPDSIYHEYTHLITGKYLGNNAIGRSLAEGISDYYAASMIDYPELYSHKTCEGVKRQLLVSSFRLDREIGFYDSITESDFKKNFTFIPSILWKYRSLVGKELADLTIFQAITKTNVGDRFFPEFTNTLSNSLYLESKKQLGEAKAKELVNQVETEIWIPRGIFSSFGYQKSVFSIFPRKNLRLTNADTKTYEFCQNQNEFEFFWQDVNVNDPTLRFYWKCNQVKLPLMIQFDQSNSRNYLISSNLLSLNGKMKFASPNACNPKVKRIGVDEKLYLQMCNYAQENYFYRKSMEKEIRLSWVDQAESDANKKFVLEFAYLGNDKNKFKFQFE
ncbi:hypothetical protein [Leptospira bouyouniensis]|uniref:Peptidase MA family protein n=1 Tax=Leptospira bouyouniensis TaxID=2484911 RepID=A0ABY2L7D6_9LEPT|nr:hypothetical protein [Leptospira bouyouniensis]TGK52568.1 hypothetical protein EHQ10_02130 [Leptospira bouyouniensis]